MPFGANALPITVADLGDLNGDLTPAGSGVLATGAIDWYSFSASDFSYLDITTNGSNRLFGSDTEIGLYDAAGNFIASDDDHGGRLDSLLSFGTGSGINYGFRDFGLGADGALAGGSFFLAIGMFNTTFGATYADVSSTGSGEYTLSFFSDATAVSAPATLGLFGLGLAGLGWSKRKKA